MDLVSISAALSGPAFLPEKRVFSQTATGNRAYSGPAVSGSQVVWSNMKEILIQYFSIPTPVFCVHTPHSLAWNRLQCHVYCAMLPGKTGTNSRKQSI